jgi:hypothetical protein
VRWGIWVAFDWSSENESHCVYIDASYRYTLADNLDRRLVKEKEKRAKPNCLTVRLMMFTNLSKNTLSLFSFFTRLWSCSGLWVCWSNDR